MDKIMTKHIENTIKKLSQIKKNIKTDKTKKLSRSINIQLANYYCVLTENVINEDPADIKEYITDKANFEIGESNATDYASDDTIEGRMMSIDMTADWDFANKKARVKFERMEHNNEKFDFEVHNQDDDITNVHSIILPTALEYVSYYIDSFTNFVNGKL